MSDRLSRLRDIVRSAQGPGTRAGAISTHATSEERSARLAAALGGVALETTAGSCVVVQQSLPCDVPHGRCSLADGRALDRASLELLAQGRPGAGSPEAPIFLDLETTGLSGGAGTRAFLVGCARFVAGAFEIHQFLLAGFAAERALLAAVDDWLGDVGSVITFNGKSFDVPVMETRWSFHRLEPPLANTLHLDMLHVARRLWREGSIRRERVNRSVRLRETSGVPRWAASELGSGDRGSPKEARCTLGALERSVLGVDRTGDVPGAEAPDRYFDYVRTGDPTPLGPVLEHNRLDLLSLAALTLMAVRLVRQGPSAARSPRESLALGRIFERAGLVDRARACFARAAAVEYRREDRRWTWREPDTNRHPAHDVTAEALWRLGLSLRRHQRHAEAATAWSLVLELSGVPSAIAHDASEALAIHHEHRARDLDAARAYAVRALDPGCTRRQQAIRHRLARLDRKLAVQQQGSLHSRNDQGLPTR